MLDYGNVINQFVSDTEMSAQKHSLKTSSYTIRSCRPNNLLDLIFMMNISLNCIYLSVPSLLAKNGDVLHHNVEIKKVDVTLITI